VVAGKKKIGGAVQRNRVKRRLREALVGIALRDGHDYVVIASATVLTASFEEVVRWLRGAVGEEKPGG
jgi:ribonuclease P protein component